MDHKPIKTNQLFWGNALRKSTLIIFIFLLGIYFSALLSSPALYAGGKDLNAEGHSKIMPISWDQAFPRIISLPDNDRLAQGEILCEIKNADPRTLVVQSVGLIKAKAEECFKVVRNYNQYVRLMPYTVENKVVRSFHLEGDYYGSEAVDFWTRVRVLGFDTRYLLRIAHLLDPKHNRFRSFWTLVDNPEEVSGCLDFENKPCQNDLALNLGSHQFEPFPGNSNYTLHTYTVMLSGKSWLQQTAFRLGGKKNLAEVTLAIRNALERKK
jgi:ribosome-associated toxin RatA of RatAB toxin-antitoxin module